MDKNEYTLKVAEIIMNDWRKAMSANEEIASSFVLNVDIAPMIFRAMQEAEKICNDFFKE